MWRTLWLLGFDWNRSICNICSIFSCCQTQDNYPNINEDTEVTCSSSSLYASRLTWQCWLQDCL